MNQKVSVCITAYNHEKFISQALDSVLMQKTDFDFEIIIGEDDSSDNTREIVKKYAQLYPDKIHLFLNDRKDVIYIDGLPTGRWNMVNNLNKANGDYIALLDGDDYWFDENKLQKQVDFLENNLLYSFCFTDAKILIDRGHRFKAKTFCDEFCQDEPKETICFDDFIFGHYVPTGSVVFRKSSLPNIPGWFLNIPMGDWGLFLILLAKGPAKLLKHLSSVYRVHRNSYWSSLSLNKRVRKRDIFYEIIRDKFGKKYNETFTIILIGSFRQRFKSEVKIFLKTLLFFKYLKYLLINKLLLLDGITFNKRIN